MPPPAPHPRPKRPQQQQPHHEQEEEDAVAVSVWVPRALLFLPGGMPAALAGVGAVCRAWRGAVIRALQRDVSLGQSLRHSPLPCCTTTATPPIPAPFRWTDALILPSGLSDRTLVEEGCDCTDGRGCCHPNKSSSSSSNPCPCLARAKREAAAVGGGGGGGRSGEQAAAAAPAAGGVGAGGGLVGEAVFPFECASPRCRCPAPRCRLRATQRLESPPLELRFLGPDKGWGVFLAAGDEPASIPPGAFVAEYTGELLTTEAARARLQEYDAQGLNYLLVVREEAAAVVLRTSVDATRRGNVARFVNHSCDPNLELVMVRRGALLPRLALVARRNIAGAEELTFDYGESSSSSTAGGGGQGQGQGRRRPCLCGAGVCRGWLPYFAGV